MDGLPEGEKRGMLKESTLVKGTKMVDDIKKDMVAKADPKVKGGDVQDSRAVQGHLPRKLALWVTSLACGGSQDRGGSGVDPTTQKLNMVSNAEMEELRTQVDTLLEQGRIRPS